MKTAYIIATYAGKEHTSNRHYSEHILQYHFEECLKWLQRKQNNYIPNHIYTILVICPPCDDPYPHYYQKEKWIPLFTLLGVEIEFVDYQGTNAYHSYDQWIQGYMHAPHHDYYILVEDDYYLDSNNLIAEQQLVMLYRRHFPNGVGYLCSWAPRNDIHHGHHAAISTGILSRQTFEHIPHMLDVFYGTRSSYLAQVNFSRMFLNHGIDIDDYLNECPAWFWASSSQEMHLYYTPTSNTTIHLFLPIQSCLSIHYEIVYHKFKR